MELRKEIREKFSQDVDFPQEMLFGALHEALSKIDGNTKTFINTFPRPCSTNYVYPVNFKWWRMGRLDKWILDRNVMVSL